MLLGSTSIKAVHKISVKLTPGATVFNYFLGVPFRRKAGQGCQLDFKKAKFVAFEPVCQKSNNLGLWHF